jgi:hypothetical protein
LDPTTLRRLLNRAAIAAAATAMPGQSEEVPDHSDGDIP